MLVALALAGCKGSGETTAPERSRPVRAVKSDKPAQAWVFSITPGDWSAYWGSLEPDHFYQMGGRMRYAWMNGERALADDLPAMPFRGFGGSSAAGFMFLTEDGALYRSETFVGALRYVPGSVGGYSRVAVLGDTAFACTVDAKLAMGPVAGDGVLKRREEGCHSLRTAEKRVILRSRSQLLQWTEEDRAFTPYQPGKPRPPRDDGNAELKSVSRRGAWQEIWNERYAPIAAAARAYRTPDGHFYSRRGGLSHLDGRKIPMVRGAECRLFTPDGHVTALCQAEHRLMREGYSVYRWVQGRWKQQLRLPDAEEDHRYGSGGDLVIGSDGSMVEARACSAKAEEEEEEEYERYRERAYGKGDRYERYERDETPRVHLCWYDGSDFRTVVYESPRIPDAMEAEEEEQEEEYGRYYGGYDGDDEGPSIDARDVHRQWLLLWDEDEGEHRLLNMRGGGAGRRLDYSMFGRLRGEPAFIGNALRAVVDTGQGLLVVDLRDGQTVLVPVPEEADSVAFASRDRGMAVGARLDEVWTTLDGGETWTQREIAVDGDPAAVRVDSVRCTNSACVAAPLVWITPEVMEKIDYKTPRVVAPTTALDPSATRRWRSPW